MNLYATNCMSLLLLVTFSAAAQTSSNPESFEGLLMKTTDPADHTLGHIRYTPGVGPLANNEDLVCGFGLDWVPDSARTAEAQMPAADASAPSLFTAIQEQLGFRLQPAKASVDALVIDHVKEPSEN